MEQPTDDDPFCIRLLIKKIMSALVQGLNTRGSDAGDNVVLSAKAVKTGQGKVSRDGTKRWGRKKSRTTGRKDEVGERRLWRGSDGLSGVFGRKRSRFKEIYLDDY